MCPIFHNKIKEILLKIYEIRIFFQNTAVTSPFGAGIIFLILAHLYIKYE